MVIETPSHFVSEIQTAALQDRWRNDKRPKEQETLRRRGTETLRRRGTVHLLACIGSMAVSAHTLIPLSPARFAVLWSDLDATTASNKYGIQAIIVIAGMRFCAILRRQIIGFADRLLP